MPMQPNPRAETSRLLFPSLRFCIAFSFQALSQSPWWWPTPGSRPKAGCRLRGVGYPSEGWVQAEASERGRASRTGRFAAELPITTLDQDILHPAQLDHLDAAEVAHTDVIFRVGHLDVVRRHVQGPVLAE